jgi:hypothetical protein
LFRQAPNKSRTHLPNCIKKEKKKTLEVSVKTAVRPEVCSYIHIQILEEAALLSDARRGPLSAFCVSELAKERFFSFINTYLISFSSNNYFC